MKFKIITSIVLALALGAAYLMLGGNFDYSSSPAQQTGPGPKAPTFHGK